mmetsp:Transcript_99055/g.295942  ORF Transcript_99055/g.295942 Transcript_99055/m.295942 type:complete len:246 (+) Transcript_99055:788-1525(+)
MSRPWYGTPTTTDSCPLLFHSWMRNAARCAMKGVRPPPWCRSSGPRARCVTTRSPWKVHRRGRGLSSGRSRGREAWGASSASTGSAPCRPSATQRRLQREKSTYCTGSAGRRAAARPRVDSLEERSASNSPWRMPWERMSKFMWCNQRSTNTRPLGATSTSARTEGSSVRRKGARPTSPKRASAAASSGTRTTVTAGTVARTRNPGGECCAKPVNTSCRARTACKQALTRSGLTPPAIHTEAEAL